MLNILPPIIVTITQFPIIMERSDSRLSFAAVLLCIILVVFFKDRVKKYLLSPSTLSVSIIFVLIGYMGNTLGDQFLLIGLTTIAASIISMPFYMWHKQANKENERIKRLEEIKELVDNNE